MVIGVTIIQQRNYAGWGGWKNGEDSPTQNGRKTDDYYYLVVNALIMTALCSEGIHYYSPSLPALTIININLKGNQINSAN